MPLNAKNAETEAGKPIPLIDDGTYAARAVRVVDLGVQRNPFDSEKKANEIIVTFELLDEYMVGEDGQPNLEQPRVLSEFIKLYRGADRGKNVEFLHALDPASTYDGNWDAMVTAQIPCLLNVIKKPAKGNGKESNKIESVSPPMKGQEFRSAVVEGYVFDLENPDREVWEKLGDWVKEKVSERVQGDDTEPTTYTNTEEESRAAAPSQETSDPVDPPATATEDDIPW